MLFTINFSLTVAKQPRLSRSSSANQKALANRIYLTQNVPDLRHYFTNHPFCFSFHLIAMFRSRQCFLNTSKSSNLQQKSQNSRPSSNEWDFVLACLYLLLSSSDCFQSNSDLKQTRYFKALNLEFNCEEKLINRE